MVRLLIAGMTGVSLTCSLLYIDAGNSSGAVWAFATAAALVLALKCLVSWEE